MEDAMPAAKGCLHCLFHVASGQPAALLAATAPRRVAHSGPPDMSSTTLEQLERERQATLKAIVSTGEDKKDSRERRQQLQKVMASFAECKMDDATRVCTSVDQVSSAKMPARLVLSQKGLDHLPPEVCGLKNLVELSLVGNTIKVCPAAIPFPAPELQSSPAARASCLHTLTPRVLRASRRCPPHSETAVGSARSRSAPTA